MLQPFRRCDPETSECMQHYILDSIFFKRTKFLALACKCRWMFTCCSNCEKYETSGNLTAFTGYLGLENKKSRLAPRFLNSVLDLSASVEFTPVEVIIVIFLNFFKPSECHFFKASKLVECYHDFLTRVCGVLKYFPRLYWLCEPL